MPTPAATTLLGPPAARPPTYKSFPVTTTPLATTPAPAGVAFANPFVSGPSVTLKSAADMAVFTYQGSKVAQDRGPFSITKATLTDNGKSQPVYLVALNGTNKDWAEKGGQPNGMTTNALAALYKPNRYLDGARAAMLGIIPENATVILSGHSQGGMIAQQLAADPVIQARFKVRNTVTFGAPQVGENLHEGGVRRLVDQKDQVANASLESGRRGRAGEVDPNQITRNASASNPWAAHTTSYFQPRVWHGMNALGERIYKDGNASITFDKKDVNFIRMAPGVKNFLKASFDPGSQGQATSGLGDGVLPEASVRLALATVLKGNVPDVFTFDAGTPELQENLVLNFIRDHNISDDPKFTSAVMDYANMLNSHDDLRSQALTQTSQPPSDLRTASVEQPVRSEPDSGRTI